MVCPKCKAAVSDTFFFCPVCGKQLRDRPLATSFGKQLSLYFVSLFFPPFGLWSAFRYLTQKGVGSTIIGLIATCLTIGALVAVTYEVLLLKDLMDQVLPLLNTFNQMSGGL